MDTPEILLNRIRNLASGDEARLAAMKELAALDLPDKESLLAELVRDPSAMIRAEAAALLGEHAGIASRDALVILTTDSEPAVARAAAVSLGRVGLQEDLPILRKLTEHDDPEVRAVAEAAAAALQSRSTAPSPQPDAQPSEQARIAQCAIHPERDAAGICVECGKALCEECSHGLPNPVCAECAAAAYGACCAWEDPTVPVLRRPFRTWADVLFSPARFFDSIPARGGLLQPLKYLILMSIAASFCVAGWYVARRVLIPVMASKPLPEEIAGQVLRGVWLRLAIVPAAMILAAFLGSLAAHVLALLFGAGGNGFGATFRVLAYGSSLGILLAGGHCGAMLAAPWGVVVLVLGLRHAHNSPPLRSLAASLVWLGLTAFTAMATIAGISVAMEVARNLN